MTSTLGEELLQYQGLCQESGHRAPGEGGHIFLPSTVYCLLPSPSSFSGVVLRHGQSGSGVPSACQEEAPQGGTTGPAPITAAAPTTAPTTAPTCFTPIPTLQTTPVCLMKSIKNPVEISGFDACHDRDAAALCQYLCWLEKVRSTDCPTSASLLLLLLLSYPR